MPVTSWTDLTSLIESPLAIALLSYLLGVITVAITWLLNRNRTATWNHRVEVIQSIEPSLSSDPPAGYDGQRLSVPELHWEQDDDHNRKLRKHLEFRDYKQVLDRFREAQVASKTAIANLHILAETYRELVDTDIKATADLSEWNGNPGLVHYYNLGVIRNLLFLDGRYSQLPGFSNPPRIEIVPEQRYSEGIEIFSTTFSGVGAGGQAVGQGSKSEMSALQSRLNLLARRKDLLEVVRKFADIDSRRTADPTKAGFEKARTELRDLLKFKQKALRGSCPLCPDFFGTQVAPQGS